MAGACRAGQKVRCTSTAADRCVDRPADRTAARLQQESTQRRLQLREREAASWMGLAKMHLGQTSAFVSLEHQTLHPVCVVSLFLAVELNSQWLQVKRGRRELGRHLLLAKNCIWVKSLHSTASTINAIGGNIMRGNATQ